MNQIKLTQSYTKQMYARDVRALIPKEENYRVFKNIDIKVVRDLVHKEMNFFNNTYIHIITETPQALTYTVNSNGDDATPKTPEFILVDTVNDLIASLAIERKLDPKVMNESYVSLCTWATEEDKTGNHTHWVISLSAEASILLEKRQLAPFNKGSKRQSQIVNFRGWILAALQQTILFKNLSDDKESRIITLEKGKTTVRTSHMMNKSFVDYIIKGGLEKFGFMCIREESAPYQYNESPIPYNKEFRGKRIIDMYRIPNANKCFKNGVQGVPGLSVRKLFPPNEECAKPSNSVKTYTKKTETETIERLIEYFVELDTPINTVADIYKAQWKLFKEARTISIGAQVIICNEVSEKIGSAKYKNPRDVLEQWMSKNGEAYDLLIKQAKKHKKLIQKGVRFAEEEEELVIKKRLHWLSKGYKVLGKQRKDKDGNPLERTAIEKEYYDRISKIFHWIRNYFLVTYEQRKSQKNKALMLNGNSNSGKTSFYKKIFPQEVFNSQSLAQDLTYAVKGMYNHECHLWCLQELNPCGQATYSRLIAVQNLVDGDSELRQIYQAAKGNARIARPLIICTTLKTDYINNAMEKESELKDQSAQFNGRMVHITLPRPIYKDKTHYELDWVLNDWVSFLNGPSLFGYDHLFPCYLFWKTYLEIEADIPLIHEAKDIILNENDYNDDYISVFSSSQDEDYNVSLVKREEPLTTQAPVYAKKRPKLSQDMLKTPPNKQVLKVITPEKIRPSVPDDSEIVRETFKTSPKLSPIKLHLSPRMEVDSNNSMDGDLDLRSFKCPSEKSQE